jgi:hypothetical protein
MKNHFLRLSALAVFCAPFLVAQPADDTRLKQVVIFGWHGVRSPSVPAAALNTLSVLPYPDFGIPLDNVTANGAADEAILGGYYRLWLTQEGLLTGHDSTDVNFVYFRPNVAETTTKVTAHAFAAGLLPAASVPLNLYPQANDPVFAPVGAGVALLDQQMAIAAVTGRLGDNPQLLASTYAPELALSRSLLFNYPVSQTPVPLTPAGKIDVTTIPVSVTAGSPVTLAGLSEVVAAIDPFLMEYADGMPASEVGWGQRLRAVSARRTGSILWPSIWYTARPI